jgi:hypothetical protein
VIGRRSALPRQDTQMIWYVTVELGHVSVPCVGLHDLGETERSHRRCTRLAFGKALISLTTCGHLTLAVASLVCHVSRGF